MTRHSVPNADGTSGYFVAHCPMVAKNEGDWVQTEKLISNPSFGKAMLTCGSMK